MTTLLLLILYLIFFSLGLPDGLLGAAWPSMYQDLETSVFTAGLIGMIILTGGLCSALVCGRIVRQIGTAKTAILCLGLLALALMGFSMSRRLWHLCLWALAFGAGSGGLDAVANGFAVQNCRARQIGLLHSFRGVGAAAGPCLMGLCFTGSLNWHSGYQIAGITEVVLTMLLFMSLPAWRGMTKKTALLRTGNRKVLSIGKIRKLPGMKNRLAAFFFCGALEASASIWAGSYIVLTDMADALTAARWVSLFFIGIVAGRLGYALAADRIGDRRVLHLGQAAILLGLVCLLLPGQETLLAGLLILGTGCAPVYPALIHSTDLYDDADRGYGVMGMQMAASCLGGAVIPAVFGLLAVWTGADSYPVYLLVLLAALSLTAGKAVRYQM